MDLINVEDLFLEINNNKSSVAKTIKIYFFKLFFNLLNKNWEAFSNYKFSRYEIKFCKIIEDAINKEENIKSFLTNYFLIIDTKKDEKDFLEETKKFEINKKKTI